MHRSSRKGPIGRGHGPSTSMHHLAWGTVGSPSRPSATTRRPTRTCVRTVGAGRFNKQSIGGSAGPTHVAAFHDTGGPCCRTRIVEGAVSKVRPRRHGAHAGRDPRGVRGFGGASRRLRRRRPCGVAAPARRRKLAHAGQFPRGFPRRGSSRHAEAAVALGGRRRFQRGRQRRRAVAPHRRRLGLLPDGRFPRDRRGTRLGEPDSEHRLARGGGRRPQRGRSRRRAVAPGRRGLGLLPHARSSRGRRRTRLGQPAA